MGVGGGVLPYPMWMCSAGWHREEGGQPWQVAKPATSTTMHTPAQCPTLHSTHRPSWHQPIPALHHTPHFTHHATLPHAMLPLTKRAEEDSPIPAQHPTPHPTHHTHACHAWERRLKTHTMDIKWGGRE